MAKAKNVVDDTPVADIDTTPVADIDTTDPFDKMEEVFIQREEGKNQQNYIFAAVNGRSYKVQRGKTMTVPAPIKEVIMNSLDAQDEAIQYSQDAASKSHENA